MIQRSLRSSDKVRELAQTPIWCLVLALFVQPSNAFQTSLVTEYSSDDFFERSRGGDCRSLGGAVIRTGWLPGSASNDRGLKARYSNVGRNHQAALRRRSLTRERRSQFSTGTLFGDKITTPAGHSNATESRILDRQRFDNRFIPSSHNRGI